MKIAAFTRQVLLVLETPFVFERFASINENIPPKILKLKFILFSSSQSIYSFQIHLRSEPLNRTVVCFLHGTV